MIISASLILGSLSVTVHVFHVPKTHRGFPLLMLMRSASPGRCLVVFTFLLVLFSAAMSQIALCLFPLSKGLFCRCYKSVMLQQIQFYNVYTHAA
jgi:hypothetical protein